MTGPEVVVEIERRMAELKRAGMPHMISGRLDELRVLREWIEAQADADDR